MMREINMKKAKSVFITLGIIAIICFSIFWNSVKLYVGSGLYYARVNEVEDAEWVDFLMKFEEEDGKYYMYIYLLLQTVDDENVAPEAIMKSSFRYSAFYYEHLIGDLYKSPEKSHRITRLDGAGEKIRFAWVLQDQVGYDWFYNKLDLEVPDENAAVYLLTVDGAYITWDGLELERIARVPDELQAYVDILDNYK